MKILRYVPATLSFLIISACADNAGSDITTDSVQKAVAPASDNDDSVFIVALVEDAWKLQFGNPDSCIIVANQALSLAEKHNYPLLIAESLCRIGNGEEAKGNFSSAIENYREAFRYDSVAQDAHGMAREEYQIGIVLKKQGHYTEALQHSNNALARWEKMPDKKTHVVYACTSIGNIYQREGKFDLALQFFFRALDTAESVNSNPLKADAFNSIGLVYENQKLYDLALEKYHQSLTIDEARGNKKGIASSYNNIGNIYYHKAQLDSALLWYLQSASLKETLGLTHSAAGTYNNIGLIYEGLQKYPEALEYHAKSLEVRLAAGDIHGTASSQNNIGVILMRQGYNEAALDSFKRALLLTNKTKDSFIRLEILRNVSAAYAATSDYQTAFHYTQQYQDERDTMENRFRKAAETDTRYKDEKTRREFLEKEQERQKIELEKNKAINQTQRTVLISVVIFAVLALLLFFANWRRRKEKLQAERDELANRKKIEDLIHSQELNALRVMLETQETERKRIAHDLHDRLGIKLSTAKLYYAVAGKQLQGTMTDEDQQKYDTGIAMLDEACDELRKVAYDLVSGELMKFGLVNALQNLCTSIQAASPLKIDFHAHGMDDRLDSATEHSLYQIVQEILTNILKHAKAHVVTIQINRYNHTLNTLVEDDGVGFILEDQHKENGLGLRSIRERVLKLNGTLQIDSSPGRGTTVSIDLSI